MKTLLFWLILALSASALAAENQAAISYSAGAFSFEERPGSGASDLDEMRVHAGTGKSISLQFNRSRGVADVVELTAQGNLRVGGQSILRPDGHTETAKKGHWQLNEHVSVQLVKSKLIVNDRRQECRVSAPSGFSFEALSAGQLPRSMAANDNYAYAILEAPRQEGRPTMLQPLRVNLSNCQVSIGTQFASPGFDYRLQIQENRALLASRAESALLLSNDGLAWHQQALPDATHVLLAAKLTAGAVQVAVSRADKDFALGFFSKLESAGTNWQEDSNIETKPIAWIEAAREIALSKMAQ